MLDINDHNDQGWAGFEPGLLFSVEEGKQSAMTTRPERHILNVNHGKCIDTRPNDLTTVQKIMNELTKGDNRVSIVQLQIQFDDIQNTYVTLMF